MKASRAIVAHSPESSAAVALGYQPGWLVGNLPVVMQEDSLTARFVTIFEEIASTVRFAVESSADAADLSVTNAAMIDYLGRWLNTGWQHRPSHIDAAHHRASRRVDGSSSWYHPRSLRFA
jgi:hypothetical protein